MKGFAPLYLHTSDHHQFDQFDLTHNSDKSTPDTAADDRLTIDRYMTTTLLHHHHHHHHHHLLWEALPKISIKGSTVNGLSKIKEPT
ncbi:POU domain, class 4, transcription factor 2-like [Cotesia glomerata]|uniref:POU domain, class 4, transcription factor 2-like n=1 Tax=Cotesia glomerata TaxID=32391 RepID=UPI001D0285FE|nr:POU domain, class 4, transcription factor 2-like [Cotesia glomerata]